MRIARDLIEQMESDEKVVLEEREWSKNQITQWRNEGKSIEEINRLWLDYEREYARGKQVWLQGLADNKDERMIDVELNDVTKHASRLKKVWEVDIRNL